MRTLRLTTGHTLPELLIVLAILGIVASMSAPRVVGAVDAFAVRGARDATAALIARARVLAVARGSAVLMVDGATSSLRLESPVGRLDGAPVALSGPLRVDVETDGVVAVVALRFDGLGVGRFANHTMRFHRGRAEARLTLSSYGRPRRW